MELILHGWNFRGFRELRLDLQRVNFVVGDNSSGKTSLLHFAETILNSSLNGLPMLSEELSVDRFDYFSPYLQNADVTLAYERTHKEKYSCKMITLARKKDGEPHVTRCTFVADETLVTIKKHGERLMFRRAESRKRLIEEVRAEHFADTGFSFAKGLASRDIQPNDFFALAGVVDMDPSGADIWLPLYAPRFPHARHAAPLRSLPEKFYDLKRTIEASGKHFAVMWRDLDRKSSTKYFRKVVKFGKESGLFDSIDVFPVTRRIPDAPLVVTVKKGGHNFFLNQVGVGVSQVVPILVEVVFAEMQEIIPARGNALLLQQPELHLHPVAQAAMGTFFYEASKSKVPIVIETHSNFLIDRFRYEMRNSNSEEKRGCSILFCRNTPQGNECEHSAIADNGRLENPPKGYFEFFAAESLRTMF